MSIINFTEFAILEAKKQKEDIKSAIHKMFKDKPTVTKTSNAWPTEKGIYSQSGIISHLSGEYPKADIVAAISDLGKEIQHISVKNFKYNSSYPYYYSCSKEEATKIKDGYEKEGKENNKPKEKDPVVKAKGTTTKKRVAPSSKSDLRKDKK